MRIEFSNQFLGDPGQRAGFVLLVSFLVSFLFIRTSARLIRRQVRWWPGNVVTESGLHVHHLVWGILLMLVAGFLGFAMNQESPTAEILAAFFGVGAGLTLDEFALWLHLKDVYWTEEGRASFNAVVAAAVMGGLIVLGAVPFDVSSSETDVAFLCISIAIDVAFSAVAILKGKPLLGLVGIFIPLASIIGALRLASPSSPWARWRYAPDGREMARAQARWKRIEARRRRVADFLTGAPEVPDVHGGGHNGSGGMGGRSA